MKQKYRKKKLNPKQSLVVLLAGCAFILWETYFKPEPVPDVSQQNTVTLIRCVDGDTARLELNGIDESVRFLALDTPELASKDAYAQEAKDFTCRALESATTIHLEYDRNSDERDKYNRVLAWVFVDGQLLQEAVLEEGLGQVRYAEDDYKYVEQLYEAQDRAQQEKIGLWN